MAIIAGNNGSNKEFELAPTGTMRMALAHVFDIGMQKTDWGPKHQVVLIFELDASMEDGRPFALWVFATLSMFRDDSKNLKSKCVEIAEALLGRTVTEEECESFDLESLIGMSCLGKVIAYRKRDGGEGRRIDGYSPLMKGQEPLCVQLPEPSDKLLDAIDRIKAKAVTGDEESAAVESQHGDWDNRDDDLPF